MMTKKAVPKVAAPPQPCKPGEHDYQPHARAGSAKMVCSKCGARVRAGDKGDE